MVTPLSIRFIHDFDRQQFTREIQWSGPVPGVGSVITWKLDASEVLEFTGSQWTVTAADYVTRLDTSGETPATAEVVQVNLVAHYGAKSTW